MTNNVRRAQTKSSRALLKFLATAALTVPAFSVQAANIVYDWNSDATASGPWSTATNWVGSTKPPVSSAGDYVDLSSPTAGATARVSTLDFSVTLGALEVFGQQSNMTLNSSGGSTLTMDGTGIAAVTSAANSKYSPTAGVATIALARNNSVSLTVNPNVQMVTNLNVGIFSTGSTNWTQSVNISGNITNASTVPSNAQRNLVLRNGAFGSGGTVNISGTIGATGASTGTVKIQNLSTSSGAVNLSGAIGGNTGIGATVVIGNETGSGTGTLTFSGSLGQSVTSVTQASATSTMILTGNNSAYSGTTTVTAGTLATGATGSFGSSSISVSNGAILTLGNNTSIGNSATLTFGSTSTINLNFVGSETLGALGNSVTSTFIGTGTYTATELNGIFGGSVFAGTGSLNVTSAIPEPSTYAALAGAVILGFAVCRRRQA